MILTTDLGARNVCDDCQLELGDASDPFYYYDGKSDGRGALYCLDCARVIIAPRLEAQARNLVDTLRRLGFHAWLTVEAKEPKE